MEYDVGAVCAVTGWLVVYEGLVVSEFLDQTLPLFTSCFCGALSLTHIVAEFLSGHQINICLLFFRTGAVKSHFHSDKKKLQAGKNHCSDAALTNMNKLQLISLPRILNQVTCVFWIVA